MRKLSAVYLRITIDTKFTREIGKQRFIAEQQPTMLRNEVGWGVVAIFVERALRLKREEVHLDN